MRQESSVFLLLCTCTELHRGLKKGRMIEDPIHTRLCVWGGGDFRFHKEKQADWPLEWAVSLHVPWVREVIRLKQGAHRMIKRHKIKRHGNGAGMDTKPEERCVYCCKTTKRSSLNLIFKISRRVKILLTTYYYHHTEDILFFFIFSYTEQKNWFTV